MDFNSEYLLSGSTDLVVRAFRRTSDEWEDYFDGRGHQAGIRQVHLFRSRPSVAVTGDIQGGMMLWDLEAKCQMEGLINKYLCEGYRLHNAVLSISEVRTM